MKQAKLQAGDGRVNINILEISELRWTGVGEFHSDDHCIYYRVRVP